MTDTWFGITLMAAFIIGFMTAMKLQRKSIDDEWEEIEERKWHLEMREARLIELERNQTRERFQTEA